MMDPTPSTPKPEIDRRIDALQRQLKERAIDGALILQNTDLFYFAGTIQQSHLYVPAEGRPLLMVRKSLSRARAESPLERVVGLNSPKALMDLIRQHGLAPPAVIGMELDVLPAAQYLGYRQLLPKVAISDIAASIRTIRAVKSAYELERMRQAARLADAVSGAVAGLIKPGITEIELAGKVEAEARRLGHQGIVRMRLWGAEMFYGHLMAGPAAAVPSFLASPTGGAAINAAVAQGPSFRKIQPTEPILVDYIFAWQGYLSDHTRIFVIGDPPPDLVDAHQKMLDLQAHLKVLAKPGAIAGDLYRAAVAFAAEKGLGDHFMGVGDDRVRFVGHGIGLEVDEFPFLAEGQKTVLAAGMTIALEPKLIFPGKGVVGIENTHLVTPEGLEQLTQAEEQIIRLPAA